MGPYILQESPRVTASLLSRIFFWWMTPLFLKGRKTLLGSNDMYRVLEKDKSIVLGDRLEAAWSKELTQQSPSLLRSLIRVFGKRYLVLGILVGIEELIVQIGQTVCLGLLIRYFEAEGSSEGKERKLHAYTAVFGVILCSILYPVMHHTYFFQAQQQGMQIRVACASLIYRKTLKVKLGTLRKLTAGQVVNLISSDISRFDSVLGHLHFVWIAPIQLAIVIYILWSYFGSYCLMGIILLVLFGPTQGLMGKLLGHYRLKTAIRTDNRLKVLNQVLSSIQAVKVYIWEEYFSKQVVEARMKEISLVKNATNIRAVNATLHHISTKLVVFVTLLVYVLNENSLSSEKVFVTLALYNSVRQVFTFFVPLAAAQWAETMVSVRRIQDFLQAENKQSPDINNKILGKMKSENTAVEIRDLDAGWNVDKMPLTLLNISLNVEKKSLVGIVGKTGSGKSSILQAILGELPPLNGVANVDGTVSYAAQEPWLFEATIRENILFGQMYDYEFYNKVLDCCALRVDLSLLPMGDQTFVGDKGAGLSGGQKARVSLARAVYANSDILLLDDPLSSLDAQVAGSVFNDCILGLLKNKTVILVTHQVQFLLHADLVAVFQEGSIRHVGVYSELLDTCVELSGCSSATGSAVINTDYWSDSYDVENCEDCVMEKRLQSSKLEEATSKGSEVGGFFLKYIRAGTGFLGIGLLIFMSIWTQVLYTGSDFWLRIWLDSEETRWQQNGTNCLNFTGILSRDINCSSDNMQTELKIYCILFGTLVISSLTRNLLYFRMCMGSSIALHQNLYSAVVRAPMKFFDGTSLGKLLNVFAKDIGIIDDLIPVTLFEAIEAALNVAGVLIIVSMVNPVLLGPSTVVVVVLILVRRIYLQTARNIKRLEGFARGPVFAHLSSSLSGLVTIRAHGAETMSRTEFENRQDLHSSAWFLLLCCTRWLAFIVELISIMFISCVTLSFMIFASDGSSVGLAITSAMTLTGMFQWGVRQSAEAESQLISVERVWELSHVKPEPTLQARTCTQPNPDWPSFGSIAFHDLTISYNNDDKPVLHQVSFSIQSGEKIGIVGRTGAGKSTIVSSMFRLVDPDSGYIEIDGVNIHQIGLQDIRSKISIIPQEPTLFNGSIRDNLDPFRRHGDDSIWQVINDIRLEDVLSSGLDTEVTGGGSNFSVGQRQLFCLGRTLLLKNKILVLDEATSSLDKETDRILQATIKKHFANCTVITVAHRMDTIIDCNKILVLDDGRVMEFDTPGNLLQKSSLFSKMVQQQGITVIGTNSHTNNALE